MTTKNTINRDALKAAITAVTTALHLGKKAHVLTEEQKAAKAAKAAAKAAAKEAVLDNVAKGVRTGKRNNGTTLGSTLRINMAFSLIKAGRQLPAEFLALSDWSKVAELIVCIGTERKIAEQAVRAAFGLPAAAPVEAPAPTPAAAPADDKAAKAAAKKAAAKAAKEAKLAA
jgi:hypothetical protein